MNTTLLGSTEIKQKKFFVEGLNAIKKVTSRRLRIIYRLTFLSSILDHLKKTVKFR